MFKEFDAFDLAAALFFWLQDNWEGQTDELYVDFCRLTAPGRYRPSPSQEIDESALTVYDNLTRDNYKEALEIVLNYKSKE